MRDKDKIASLLKCTDEERILVFRAIELCERGDSSALATAFLTPREQRLVYEAVRSVGGARRLFLWGGYVGAQRRKAVFLPEWLEVPSTDEGVFSREREREYLSCLEEYGMTDILSEFISALTLAGSGYRELTHRDFLGALMSLGIKRSVIGDICVEGSSARLFCDVLTGEFVEGELKRAGRDAIKCKSVPIDTEYEPDIRFDDVCVTVASLRLDGVVRALLSVSREDGARLVSQGDVEINYFVQKETDAAVAAGDIVSVRGYGKYIIEGVGELTRRGRIRVLAKKYV